MGDLRGGRVIKTFLVFIPVIGLILPSVVPAGEESIVLRYDFNPPRVEAESRYFKVTMADLPLMQNAGQPALPYKSLRVLIPRGREVQNIEIEESEKVTLEGSYPVRPAPQPVPLSYEGAPISTSPDKRIYDSLAPFPPELQSDISIQKKGPYRVLLLNIHPVSYVPATGKISYYTSLTVKVKLEPAMERFTRGAARRPVPEDTASIGRKVENPASLSSYLSGEIDTGDEGGGEPLRESGPLGGYPHVIITSQALADAAGAGKSEERVPAPALFFIISNH